MQSPTPKTRLSLRGVEDNTLTHNIIKRHPPRRSKGEEALVIHWISPTYPPRQHYEYMQKSLCVGRGDKATVDQFAEIFKANLKRSTKYLADVLEALVGGKMTCHLKEILDDTHVKVHFQWVCWQRNPRTWHCIERLNLDGFEKLLASVIQKGLPVISVPKFTIAQRTATSIFSISLNNSRRSFLSKRYNIMTLPKVTPCLPRWVVIFSPGFLGFDLPGLLPYCFMIPVKFRHELPLGSLVIQGMFLHHHIPSCLQSIPFNWLVPFRLGHNNTCYYSQK